MANGFVVVDAPGAIERGRQFHRNRQMAGLQQQAAEQGLEQGRLRIDEAKQSALTREQESQLSGVVNSALTLKTLQNSDKAAFLEGEIGKIDARGGDSTQSRGILNLVNSGKFDEVDKAIGSVLTLGERKGIIKPLRSTQRSAGQAEFESLIANFSDADKSKARRVKAGLDPRSVGSATQTIANLGTELNIANVEAVIAGAKEDAKLISQKKLKPQVEAAVVEAVGQARANLDASKEGKSNAKALAVYETAIEGLADSLGGTETGRFVGLIPAITANAQIADGAVAMMAPVLKQIFRGAGEGTFTDADQKVLLNMIPTRSDLPKARVAKLSMIDALIKAKLAQPVGQQQEVEAELSPLTEAEQAELEQLRAELGQ